MSQVNEIESAAVSISVPSLILPQQPLPPPPPPPPLPPPFPLSLSLSCQKSKLNFLGLNLNKQPKISENEIDVAIKRLLSFEEKLCKIFYMSNTSVKPQLQDGPKCGLVALSIASSGNKNFVNVEDIFKTAISLGLTKQGEMFSTESLALLAEKCCRFKTRIIKNGLSNHLHCIVRSLLRKCLILVPYDADFNYSPCCKKGNKAHWAVITGFLILESKYNEKVAENNSFVLLNSGKCSTLCNCVDNSDDIDLPLNISIHQEKVLIEKKFPKGIHDDGFNEGKIYLIGVQGKSLHVDLWLFDEMARSNDNLYLFPSDRDPDNYVLPEGGPEEGLKGKAIILGSS